MTEFTRDYLALSPEERNIVYSTVLDDEQRYDLLTEILDEKKMDQGVVARLRLERIRVAKILSTVTDPRWDFEHLIKIRPTRGSLCYLHMNEVQELQLYTRWIAAKRQRRPIRWLIPKSRKTGVSTWVACGFYHDTARRENRNTTIASHDWTSAKTLRRIYETMYRHDMDGVKPEADRANTSEMEFMQIGSIIRVLTAKNKEAGRADTIHNLHLSEIAFWDIETADEALTSLENAVPKGDDDWDTAIVKESTGNGDEGPFYEECTAAEEGRNDWELIFLPWFQFESYRKRFDSPRQRDEFDMEVMQKVKHQRTGKMERTEERVLMEKYDLDLEQLHWRRHQLRNTRGKTDAEKRRRFMQDFPATLQECFQSQGTGRYYDQDLVRDLIKIAPSVHMVADLSPKERSDDDYVTPPIILTPSNSGDVRLMFDILTKDGEYHPESWRQFCIGADVGEGGRDSDPSTAVVFDRDENRIAAYVRERMATGPFARLLQYLSKFWNDAVICPERNSAGVAVVSDLLRTDRIGFLYREIKPGVADQMESKNFGWRTTSASKPYMLGLVQAFLADHGTTAGIPAQILREVLKYSKSRPRIGTGGVGKQRVRTGAPSGGYDDLHDALGLALLIHREWPYIPVPDKERGTRPFTSKDCYAEDDEQVETESLEHEALGSVMP